MARSYYSIRTGKHPYGKNIPLPILAFLVYAAYSQLTDLGYFQEYFGYSCVDEGTVPGKLGSDIPFRPQASPPSVIASEAKQSSLTLIE